VWQAEGLRYADKMVAENQGIDISTVSRIAGLFRITG